MLQRAQFCRTAALRSFLFVSVCVLLCGSSLGKEKEYDWNIAEGIAKETLNLIAQQGNLQIMFSDDSVQGVVTNEVMGHFTAPEALDRLLEQTQLRIVQTDKRRIYAIQLAREPAMPGALDALEDGVDPDPDGQRRVGTAVTGFFKQLFGKTRLYGVEDLGDEPFELSPFLVQASENDFGYYSENTLAGSRLNSKVSDLAASITVVSRQQLEDTASVDLNDMFLYEANTEGLNNYTAFEIDKDGAARDIAAGYSNGSIATGPYDANRIRGIGPAETARNYYPSINRIPFDAYNTATFEINRGPNSILFGLGNAAGIVNQSFANALIGDESTEMRTRIGSWGARRASFRHNHTLLEDKLAVLVAGVYDDKGFRRKPSWDTTERVYVNLKFQPTKSTTITCLFESYYNDNRRPNIITPRDLVTPWREAGSPVWNPVERTVTVNGTVSGPYDTDDGLPDQLWSETNRPLYYYDKGKLQAFAQRRLSPDPYEVEGDSVYRTMVSGYYQAGPLWIAQGVTDLSVYNWEKINIVSGNVGEDRALLWGVDVDQEILPGLFFNAGFYSESFDSRNSYYLTQQTGATIQVDPNSHQLDGSVNPFYGKPFIEVREPDDFDQWEENRNFRVALAYSLNFRDWNPRWTWLGNLNLLGLYSTREVDRGSTRWRQTVTSTHPWIHNSDRSLGTGGALYRRFYLGDSSGSVTYDPGVVLNQELWYPLYRATPSAGTALNSPISNWDWGYELVKSAPVLHPASGSETKAIHSSSLVMQHYLLENRIIATAGWRQDRQKARSSVGLEPDPETGLFDEADLGKEWYPEKRVANTTKSLGVVAKLTDFLSFHYNQSDNFRPEDTRFDIRNGSVLPFPTGHGTDFGASLDIGDGKFYARANWFEIEQRDTRVSSQLWRMGYLDWEAFQDWAHLAANYEGLTGAAAEQRIEEILQFPDGFETYWFRTSSLSDVFGKGLELNLIYNPTRNWTIKFNLARQVTTYHNISREYEDWKATRLEVWKQAHSDAMPAGYQDFWTYNNLTAPDTIRHIGVIGGAATATPETWFFTNVDALMTLSQKLEDKVTAGQREWRWNVITNYVFEQGLLKDFSVGGGVRWEDDAIIGYRGGEADIDGVVRQLDADKPVYDDAQFHLDLWCSYKMRLFQDKVGLKLQLNIRDVLEDGTLQAVGVNPDGSPSTFRIVDPRQFFLSAAFEF